MTPARLDDNIRKILNHLRHSSTPMAAEDIHAALGPGSSRRSIQRLLARLVADNKLVAEGQGRARRYRLPALQVDAVFPSMTASFEIEQGIPATTTSANILRSVRRPVHLRTPVGYNREFLDHYRPNETAYLTTAIRQHLHAIGKAPGTEQPAGTYARQILGRLLIDLSWNSSRLEGNTYSLLETEQLVELGKVAEGKDALEAQMILNHKEAIEFLVDAATEADFNRYTILNLHALLSNNLLGDPSACGRLRHIAVGIGGTTYLPLEVPQLVDECFGQLLDTAAAIRDPFEQAFFVMVQLPYLQPFEDVNKRVSRLAANIPLIRSNYCPLSFVDVPQRLYIDATLGVYELNRVELLRDVFVWAYERSCARYSAVRKSLGDPDPFRLRHREMIFETIADIVRRCLDKQGATASIRMRAQQDLPTEDRGRFIEVVETELISLHEGNIARYRLRPSEYAAWRKTWH